MESRRPRQPDDQGPRYSGGHSGVQRADQLKASMSTSRCFSRRKPTMRSPRPIFAAGRVGGERRRRWTDRERRQLLRQPHRHGDRKPDRAKIEAATSRTSRTCCAACRAKSRSPTRSWRIKDTVRFMRTALEGAGEQRRADAASVMGQHEHEKSGLPGCAVRRGTHWARYREHHSAGDLQRFSRSRPAAGKFDRRHGSRRRDNGETCQGRNLHEGRYR